MKNCTKLIVLIAMTAIFISCDKDQSNSNAGCDVNGYWYGTWTSDSDYQGTFISAVEQSETHFEGEVSINIHSPELVGYTRDYSGTIKDKNVRISMALSGVDIFVEGNVNDIQTVEGQFKVPDLQMTGTFAGQMLPSSAPTATKIYSFTAADFGESIYDILFVDNKLWIFMYPYEYVGDEAMFKTIITDLDGNVLNTSYFPDVGYSYSYDGTYIYSIYNGSTLFKFDVDGNRLDTIDLSFSSSNVTGDGQNLYFPLEIYSVIKTDLNANIIDTIDFDYITVSQPIVNSIGFLSYNTKTIFQSNKEGKIQHAYSFKDAEYVSKIVANNETVWALVSDYSSSSGDTYYVYKIPLQ
jgi:hypothetical protein